MNNSHYIPRKEADFYRWVENFLTSLRQNIQKFNFPQEVFDHLEALQADFNAKFAIAKDPNTRTSLGEHTRRKRSLECDPKHRYSVVFVWTGIYSV
jgi:hypothetical protein